MSSPSKMQKISMDAKSTTEVQPTTGRKTRSKVSNADKSVNGNNDTIINIETVADSTAENNDIEMADKSNESNVISTITKLTVENAEKIDSDDIGYIVPVCDEALRLSIGSIDDDKILEIYNPLPYYDYKIDWNKLKNIECSIPHYIVNYETKNGAKPICVQFNNLEMLQENKEIAKFGFINEIEYSSSAFLNVDLEDFIKEDIVTFKNRLYLRDEIELYISKDEISTVYIPNSVLKRFDFFIRFDYPTSDVCDEITAKLRLCRTKFTFYEHKYQLTGAMEIELPHLRKYFSNARLASYYREREFAYVSAFLKFMGKRYHFRIAFRREDTNRNIYQLNIECEDPINGYVFAACYDALYKYIRHNIFINRGKFLLEKNLHNLDSRILSSEQILALKSLYFTRYTNVNEYVAPMSQDGVQDYTIEHNIEELLQFLSYRMLKGYSVDMPMKKFGYFSTGKLVKSSNLAAIPEGCVINDDDSSFFE